MKAELSHEQSRALQTTVQSNGGFIWHRVGEGKTRIALHWLATLARPEGEDIGHALIVIRPNSLNDWLDEIILCGFHWNVRGSDPVLHPHLQTPGALQVTFISYAELERKGFSYPDAVDAVVFDEGWLYKNFESYRTQSAAYLSGRCHGRALLLSGSMMTANSVLDIWGQATAIGRTRHLAKNLTAFRSNYMISFPTLFNPALRQWSTKVGAKERIVGALKDCADVHFPKNSERRIHQAIHRISLTQEQKALIAELKRDYLADFKGRMIDVKNGMHLVTTIQKISNGWVWPGDLPDRSEGGVADSNAANLVNSLKVSWLIERLQSLQASKERAVVWCAFRYDVEMLGHFLTDQKIPYVTLRGGEQFDMQKWKHKDTVCCLATEASGSSINHFAQVPYAIYYSMNFKWHDLQQSMGRTDRKSSQHNACYYDFLFGIGTFDSYVYRRAIRAEKAESQLIDLGEIQQWLKEQPDQSHSTSVKKTSKPSKRSTTGSKSKMAASINS